MKKTDKTPLNEEKVRKACGIFNQDFLEKIKQRQFSGKMHVIWHDGDLKAFNLSSKLMFKKSNRRGLDDFDFFDFDDEFW